MPFCQESVPGTACSAGTGAVQNCSQPLSDIPAAVMIHKRRILYKYVQLLVIGPMLFYLQIIIRKHAMVWPAPFCCCAPLSVLYGPCIVKYGY